MVDAPASPGLGKGGRHIWLPQDQLAFNTEPPRQLQLSAQDMGSAVNLPSPEACGNQPDCSQSPHHRDPLGPIHLTATPEVMRQECLLVDRDTTGTLRLDLCGLPQFWMSVTSRRVGLGPSHKVPGNWHKVFLHNPLLALLLPYWSSLTPPHAPLRQLTETQTGQPPLVWEQSNSPCSTEASP